MQNKTETATKTQNQTESEESCKTVYGTVECTTEKCPAWTSNTTQENMHFTRVKNQKKMRKNKTEPRKCSSNKNGAFGEGVVSTCAETLLKEGYIDCVIVIGVGLLEAFTVVLEDTIITEMGTKRELDEAKLLAELKHRYGKPIIGLTIHANEDSRVLRYLRQEGGIPVYEEPQTAALAIRAMLDHRDYVSRLESSQ